MENKLKKVNEILKKYHQEHLLDFYNILSQDEKENLIDEILATDFDTVITYYNQSMSAKYISSDRISPIPYISKDRKSVV